MVEFPLGIVHSVVIVIIESFHCPEIALCATCAPLPHNPGGHGPFTSSTVVLVQMAMELVSHNREPCHTIGRGFKAAFACNVHLKFLHVSLLLDSSCPFSAA